MHRSSFLVVALLIGGVVPFIAGGQPSLEAANWYFGDRAGVSFLTTPPSVLMTGVTHLHNYGSYPQRGVSSISDRNGRLLCYTNGELLFNRFHQPAANGSNLGGHGFASQHIIVPQPGNRNLYYIFTTDSWMRNYANGLRYSVYDVCQDSVTSKNNVLWPNAAENVAAVQHANGLHYWIVAYGRNGDSIYAYRLTDLGLSAPVISTTGYVLSPTDSPGYEKSGQGELKISPNGTYLAVAATAYPDTLGGGLMVCRFNRASGTVSNCISLPAEGTEWSVAFTPDESRLFVGCLSGKVIRYDLTPTLDSAAIQNSRTVVVDSPGGPLGGLQLAIDSHIYLARGFYLGRFDAAAGYAFVDSAIDLRGRYAAYSLPNLLAGFRYFPKAWIFNPYIQLADSAICAGVDSAYATYPEGEAGWTYVWDFGDGTLPTVVNSDSGRASHLYHQPGRYKINLIVDDGCFVEPADSVWIKVVGISVQMTPDTFVCLNSAPAMVLRTQGSDSPALVRWFLNDSLACLGCDTFQFRVRDTAAGVVRVEVTSTEGCITTDSTRYTVSAPPKPQFEILNIPCERDSVKFRNYTDTFGTTVFFEWDFADTVAGPAKEYTYDAVYIYRWGGYYYPMLITIDSIGCRDTLQKRIRVKFRPRFSAGADQKLCERQSAVLGFGADSLIHRYSFEWSPTDGLSCPKCPHPIVTPTDSITYTLRVVDTNGCATTSSVRLLTPYYDTALWAPNAFTPLNGDNINDKYFIVGTCIRWATLRIYDRWGTLLYQTTDPRRPWDGTLPGRGTKIPEGVYLYYLEAEYYNGERVIRKRTLHVLHQ